MRVLVFHGYLLAGTGSNVYNARLADALVRAGHEVHVVCQERHPERFAFVDAAGDWDGGSLTLNYVRAGRGPGHPARCTVYRPDIGGLLPVYVADAYEGMQARTFAECSDEEVARYVEANVAAVIEVCERARPQAALANHVVMGPVVLARALRGVPYAVKVHGSALEYTVKPEPERFLAPAREGLAAARGVLVGSRHTAESLWQALAEPTLPQRTRLGPPGVDVERFRPRPRAQAAERVQALAAALAGRSTPPESGDGAFARDQEEAAAALEQAAAAGGPLVAYVGKLIVSKGVDLLIAAWPLVLERVPDARLLIVGFGSYRATLERLLESLRAGDLADATAIARAGRALEGAGAEPAPLRYLLSFLERLAGPELERYVAAAAGLRASASFSGRLEHDELAELLPLCSALVVPSTFPESFGMVAVEAAACGALPVSAAHSGLAEVSDALAQELPAQASRLLSFALGAGAVRELAGDVAAWLEVRPALQAETREALVAAVRSRWSWERVGEGVLAAALGRLEQLERP